MADADSGTGGGEIGDRGPLSGKNPLLPPTPALESGEFEDFTECLLSAHRFCAEPVRRVTRVERWGRPGDKQDGIDFEGEFSDGATAAWQCKRYDRLTASDVRDAVRACTFIADEFYLVFSGEASSAARAEIDKHPTWQLLDQRGLKRMLDDLPLHKRRDVLDATFGVQQRKLLLKVPGEDAFLSIDGLAAQRLNPDLVLNDCGTHVGRDDELAALATALDRSGDWPPVVLVTGPGGRGKTRLVVETLTHFQRNCPHVAVLCLAQGRRADPAALAELPHTPAVIFIDDAHRDPSEIASLLRYVQHTEGTQLILASRPTGTALLRGEVINAGYSGGQIETVAVRELPRNQASKLVELLTDGLGLDLAARDYFADQAIDSPFVVVIASSLIRRRELTAPLAVDAHLREQVLARYQELASGGSDSTARRVLAVYAALGPVDDTDANLRSRIAHFCGVTPIDLLRLLDTQHDHGVLVTRSGHTRVVPDVLADHILESEAAVGSNDTGFTAQLWNAFGDTHPQRLILELAELDWRLTKQGGPAVFAPVWATVRAELGTADYKGLHHTISYLARLAFTQPETLMTLLEEVRSRLDAMETAEDSFAPSSDADHSEDDRPSETDWRALAGLKPLAADDVRKLLPPLYGKCARNAPGLLESALDALWALCRRDPRPTNQENHAQRILADELADLDKLPDPSFPTRIVDRVDVWLTDPADDQDLITPMFALGPLLAKEGNRTFLQTRRTLAFEPYSISATWARPVRDAIRDILREHGGGTDLLRAGVAVDLLGDALRQPHGYFGQSVSTDEVLSWEDDDLATLATLTAVAQATASSVIRRLIHQKITWASEYAKSLPVRHAALTLATELDERGDDLAQLLLCGDGTARPSRRGVAVPTLEDLQAAEAARGERKEGHTEHHIHAVGSAKISDIVATVTEAHDRLVSRVLNDLTAPGVAADVVEALAECCREIQAVRSNRTPALWSLLMHLGRRRPDLVADVVREIVARPGPLDDFLDQLLCRWAEHDETAVLAWLADLPEQRVNVRMAVARAFVNGLWANRSNAFAEIHQRGIRDPAPSVHDKFLLASHVLLGAAPAKTIDFMLSEGITPPSATAALDLACNYDGASWGRGLNGTDAAAVLNFINHAGWNHTGERIAVGIALAHPTLVLNHLTAAHRDGQDLPLEINGLAEAFDERAEALGEWLVEQAKEPTAWADASNVACLVMKSSPTTRQARHLTNMVASLDGTAIVGVATLLQDIATWPLNRPDLARNIIVRARTLGPEVLSSVRQRVADAMYPQAVMTVNGVSSALERAKIEAARCAAAEDDLELREDFESAIALIDEQIARNALSRDGDE